MALNTYLFFDGNCERAFTFYKSVFGGEFSAFMTYGEGPPEMDIPSSEQSKIMHVSLPVGGSVLMGSDNCEGFGPPRNSGQNFAISYTPKSRDDADRIFTALIDGGEVSMPLQDMFWGAYFGQGRDQFGIEWMVNFETAS